MKTSKQKSALISGVTVSRALTHDPFSLRYNNSVKSCNWSPIKASVPLLVPSQVLVVVRVVVVDVVAAGGANVVRGVTNVRQEELTTETYFTGWITSKWANWSNGANLYTISGESTLAQVCGGGGGGVSLLCPVHVHAHARVRPLLLPRVPQGIPREERDSFYRLPFRRETINCCLLSLLFLRSRM